MSLTEKEKMNVAVARAVGATTIKRLVDGEEVSPEFYCGDPAEALRALRMICTDKGWAVEISMTSAWCQVYLFTRNSPKGPLANIELYGGNGFDLFPRAACKAILKAMK